METTRNTVRKRWYQRWRKRYRLVIINDSTFEEQLSLRLSPFNVLLLAGTGAVIIITITVLLIAWTPLREFIPGYPDGSEKQQWLTSYQRADSLENLLTQQQGYLQRIQVLLKGDVIPDTLNHNSTLRGNEKVSFSETDVEKEFNRKMRDKVKYSFHEDTNGAATASPVTQTDPVNLLLFVPAQGEISRSFAPAKNHLGLDISTRADDPVYAVQEGTVIFSGWTVDGGHELHIQHTGNLVTVYKHNSFLLKKTGDRLRPGDVIAFAGNSGRLSEGNHLHFEIWHNGVPVDPEKYIVF